MYIGTVHEGGGGPTLYDASLPAAGLGWQKVSPMFERYSLKLRGQIDQRWVDCYERLAGASLSARRFQLDPAAGTVSFTCRATDGPVEVMTVLKVLEEIIEQVNQKASEDSLSAAKLPVRPGLPGSRLTAAGLGLRSAAARPAQSACAPK